MRLAVLISFSGQGGVERMVMNLVRELAGRVERLDLLVIRAEGPHFDGLPGNVNLIRLPSRHTLTAIPHLRSYLRKGDCDALLVAKDRAGRAALVARALAGASLPIVIRLGTNLSAALENKSALARWLRVAPMRALYPLADAVVAVSEGVRRDTLAITGIDSKRVTVVRNPVITESFYQSAEAEAPHPWLDEAGVPVIVGAGRLSEQKDFGTLLRAFARLRQDREARLMILGEGGQRAELEALAEQLGVTDALLMPGFQKNLYQWLVRAQCFVLSSRWEGSPNVLTEALALGVPAVATRCPSGPDEVLAEGEFGPLVPMGDAVAMADAIAAVLDQPLPADHLRRAVEEYRSATSAQRYLQVIDATLAGRT